MMAAEPVTADSGSPPAMPLAVTIRSGTTPSWSQANIETIEADDLVGRAQQIERLMKDRLHRLQADDDRIGDVRGRGAMIAVELVRSGTDEPAPDLAKAVASAAHQRGVIVLTCGTFGNVLRFLPPLAIGDDLLIDALDIFTDIFKETR